MPSSIKDAFEKAMQQTQAHIPVEWDDENPNTTITEVSTMQTPPAETKRAYFQTTNNVTRETFDCVRDNPGLTRVIVANMMEARGFKRSSTTSLLGQMLRQGLLRENNGYLFATQPAYTPLKPRKALDKKATAPKVETKVKRVASTNTLPTEDFDAQKFVDGMTLKQARAVYDCLKTVFGG